MHPQWWSVPPASNPLPPTPETFGFKPFNAFSPSPPPSRPLTVLPPSRPLPVLRSLPPVSKATSSDVSLDELTLGLQKLNVGATAASLPNVFASFSQITSPPTKKSKVEMSTSHTSPNALSIPPNALSIPPNALSIPTGNTPIITTPTIITPAPRFQVTSKQEGPKPPVVVLGDPHPLYGVRMNVPFKLFPHQEEAVAWIADKETTPWHGMNGGIVTLEMGLGKTLISLFTIARTLKSQQSPTLVLCSLSLLPTWRTDAKKFFGDSLRLLFFHEKEMTKREFVNITMDHLQQFDVVVTTYDVIRNAARQIDTHPLEMTDAMVGSTGLFHVEWHRVIADESQRFANYKGKLLTALLRLKSVRKLCLSGTPIKNYDEDLYSQFRFCNFIKVPTNKQWSPEVYRYYKLRRNILMMTFETAKMPRVPKDEKIVHIHLQGMEKQIYVLFWRLSAMTLERMEAGGCNFGALLATFIRLRQACIAPHLIHPAGKLSKRQKKKSPRPTPSIEQEEIEGGDPDEEIDPLAEDEFKAVLNSLLGKLQREREVIEMEQLWLWLSDPQGTAGMRSQKFNAIVRVLREEIPDPEKTIIFSTFASALMLLRERFFREGIGEHGCVLVDGSMKSPDREKAWNKFREDPRCRVLLMTYKVGSEGITLIEANNIILIEPWWCPAVKNQAIARAWRIGQTRKVTVFNILAEDTIEDRILEKCMEKELLALEYLGNGKAPPQDIDFMNGSRKKNQKAGLQMIRSFINPVTSPKR